MLLVRVSHVVDLDDVAITDSIRNRRGIGLFELVTIILVGRVDLILVDQQRSFKHLHRLRHGLGIRFDLFTVFVIFDSVAQAVLLVRVSHVVDLDDIVLSISGDSQREVLSLIELVARKILVGVSVDGALELGRLSFSF